MGKKFLIIILAALLLLEIVSLAIILKNTNSTINPFAIKTSNNQLKRYGNTLIQFSDNKEKGDIHYASGKITYIILNEQICGQVEASRIRKAFIEIQTQTNNLLNFTEVYGTADIEVNCFKNALSGEKKGYLIFGNSAFATDGDLVTKGKINFYNCKSNNRVPGCFNFPDVEIHEILHTFGIGHIENTKSIMTPDYHGCRYKIDKEIIDYLTRIYTNL